jgi:hypothetical protein
VRRIRWFDPDNEEPSTPVEWPVASLLLATLFLNFAFMELEGGRFWPFSPLPLYALLLGGMALLVTALLFMGPALATYSAGRPLFRVIEDSLGWVPALGMRLCCAVFLSLWIAALIAIPVWWWSYSVRDGQPSATQSSVFVAVLLTFLFVTAQQSLRTGAKLALFTNKLGTAILIAALIRVRDGWPAILDSFGTSSSVPSLSQIWPGLSELGFYVAPLTFVAASFGYRSHGRRQIAMTGLMGVALPIFVTLLLVGVIGVATHASRFYQPSLTPTVGMALWSHEARSALTGRMMITAVTMFGVVRFCAKALTEVAAIRTGTRWGWALLGCFVLAIAWCSLHIYAMPSAIAIDWSGRCLGVAGAVVMVDFLTKKRRVEEAPKVDWVGLIAVLAGLATPLFVPHEPLESASNPWWHPWLLPSYVLAFMVCICGRLLQKLPILDRLPRADRPSP